MIKQTKFLLLATLCLCLFANLALASGGIAEFAGPLKKLLDTLQGPLAQIIMIFMLILTGVGYYFSRDSDLSGIIKALIGVIFIMTLIAFATSIVTSLFPSVSGALI